MESTRFSFIPQINFQNNMFQGSNSQQFCQQPLLEENFIWTDLIDHANPLFEEIPFQDSNGETNMMLDADQFLDSSAFARTTVHTPQHSVCEASTPQSTPSPNFVNLLIKQIQSQANEIETLTHATQFQAAGNSSDKSPFSPTIQKAGLGPFVHNTQSPREQIVPKHQVFVDTGYPMPFIEIRGARKSIFTKLDELEVLNSLPYKYCIKLVLPFGIDLNNNTESEEIRKKKRQASPFYRVDHYDLTFQLICLDADNYAHEYEIPNGLTVEKHIKTKGFEDRKEIEFRMSLNVYSHSFNKKGFVIQIVDNDKVILRTKPFLVYARRNRKSRSASPSSPNETRDSGRKRSLDGTPLSPVVKRRKSTGSSA